MIHSLTFAELRRVKMLAQKPDEHRIFQLFAFLDLEIGEVLFDCIYQYL